MERERGQREGDESKRELIIERESEREQEIKQKGRNQSCGDN